jgi:hypothetical protein
MDNPNNNTLSNESSTSKKNIDYGDSIYRMIMELFDKYGVKAVDWAGYSMGLNKNGKALSQQNAEELTENLRNLTENLKKPEVREALIETIQEAKPVIQEAIFAMLDIMMGSFEYVVKDLINIVCHSDTIDPLCGLLILGKNTVNYTQDLLDGTQRGMRSVNRATEVGDNLRNKMEKLTPLPIPEITPPEISPNINPLANISPPDTSPPLNTISNPLPNNPLPNNPLPNIDNIQSGGAAMKKYIKQKNTIENRITKSIHHFLNINPKKHKKTYKKHGSKR